MTTATTYDLGPEETAMTHSEIPDEPRDISGSILPSTSGDFELLPMGWLPPDQEFYWTEKWQADEQRALDELARGEGIDFDNATDLIRWLFD